MPDPRQSDLEISNSSPNFPIDPVGLDIYQDQFRSEKLTQTMQEGSD